MIQHFDFSTLDMWSGEQRLREVKPRGPAKLYGDRLTQATPFWANLPQINRVYNEAHDMRAAGIPATVDHIYPLAGQNVCGLHVHQNLRIITYADNARKCNTSLEVPELPKLESLQTVLFSDVPAV